MGIDAQQADGAAPDEAAGGPTVESADEQGTDEVDGPPHQAGLGIPQGPWWRIELRAHFRTPRDPRRGLGREALAALLRRERIPAELWWTEVEHPAGIESLDGVLWWDGERVVRLAEDGSLVADLDPAALAALVDAELDALFGIGDRDERAWFAWSEADPRLRWKQYRRAAIAAGLLPRSARERRQLDLALRQHPLPTAWPAIVVTPVPPPEDEIGINEAEDSRLLGRAMATAWRQQVRTGQVGPWRVTELHHTTSAELWQADPDDDLGEPTYIVGGAPGVREVLLWLPVQHIETGHRSAAQFYLRWGQHSEALVLPEQSSPELDALVAGLQNGRWSVPMVDRVIELAGIAPSQRGALVEALRDLDGEAGLAAVLRILGVPGSIVGMLGRRPVPELDERLSVHGASSKAGLLLDAYRTAWRHADELPGTPVTEALDRTAERLEAVADRLKAMDDVEAAVTAERPTLWQRYLAWWGRHPRVWFAAGLLLILIAGGLIVDWLVMGEPRRGMLTLVPIVGGIVGGSRVIARASALLRKQ